MNDPVFPFWVLVHLVSFAVGFGAVIVVDTFGLLWLSGRAGITQVYKVASVTQGLIWLGWLGLVISGYIAFKQIGVAPDELFKLKIFLVAMIGLNGILLHFVKEGIKHLKDSETVPKNIQFRIAFGSVISQIGWWGSLLIGFMHSQWKHHYPWPENAYTLMILFSITALAVFFIGNALTKKAK